MQRLSKYPNKAGIYKLTCVINNKIYIGKSINLSKRIYYHKGCDKRGSINNGHLQRAIIKYGWNTFVVEILEVFDNFNKLKDNDFLLKRESYYINLYESTDISKGYNTCAFSTDRTGIPHSEETRAKIGIANLGRKISPETREKMRQSKLGKKLSKEHIEKIKLANTGKKRSEEFKEKASKRMSFRKISDETREKMRQNNLGKKHSTETKEKISVSNSGRKLSEEHIEKLRQRTHSEDSKQKMRKSRTDETKKKLSSIALNRKMSDETKEKIRQANLGKKLSEDTKQKMRKPRSLSHRENIRLSRIGRKRKEQIIKEDEKSKV
jgi:group I intron endonuclease